ncbi:aldehyde dehydrogenase family protein [Metabacillus sp. RGM 3146]|uniref:aldehyde dehydrogenase family protein n=1 Tax=Metabacillus sp. RGM 3146 TaxID=3401092 RepID=UPI003B9E72AF
MVKKHLWINGKEVQTEDYSPLYSPYTREAIAEIAVASKEQTQQAIKASFDSKDGFAKMPAFERAQILENAVTLLRKHFDEAAEIITNETSKPITFSKGEVSRTIETYKFAAEEAKRIHGETIPFDAASGGVGRVGYTVRNPIGVIGAITPFNFPMNLVAHKVGPALASGNAAVLKPASQTPLSALFIAKLFQQAGLPDGVLNVVTGPGRTVGDALVEDERVNMITFTGSTSVGINIRNKAKLKKTTLELGSNAALIIDQNVNIEKIIDRCVMGAFSNQGQVCISLQRIYVHEAIHEEFTEKFVEATKKLKLGDPFDPETYISALISPDDLDRSLNWIEEAKQNNARILTGGKASRNILEPTIIQDAAAELKVSCQEVFSPIVTINKVFSIEEAISHVNHSRFGLQAGIYTESVTNALLASNKLHVGAVIINDIPTFRVDHMPYGGVKESGTGREGIRFAVEEMTELKLIVWNQN